jgi:anti-sigma factor RsiW
MNEINDDWLLVAYADGRLDAARARQLEARLAAGAELRERLENIRRGGSAIAPAFQALLSSAPVDALQASLADLLADPSIAAKRSASAIWVRGAHIAAAIALVAVGIALGRLAPIWPPEDWRDAVAEYVGFYTAETFAGPSQSAEAEAGELARVGGKVGVDLDPDRLAIPGLQFRGATIFSYEGTPLAQIAYLDTSGHPVLFCVFANSQPDAPLQSGSRGDLAFVSWEAGGHGYMVIARATLRQVAGIADQLSSRLKL